MVLKYTGRTREVNDVWKNKYITHNFWSSVRQFSALRYLVLGLPDIDDFGTLAETHELCQLTEGELAYYRFAHQDSRYVYQRGTQPWLEIDPLSLEMSGEYLRYSDACTLLIIPLYHHR